MRLKSLKHNQFFMVVGEKENHIYRKTKWNGEYNCASGSRLFYFPNKTVVILLDGNKGLEYERERVKKKTIIERSLEPYTMSIEDVKIIEKDITDGLKRKEQLENLIKKYGEEYRNIVATSFGFWTRLAEHPDNMRNCQTFVESCIAVYNIGVEDGKDTNRSSQPDKRKM